MVVVVVAAVAAAITTVAATTTTTNATTTTTTATTTTTTSINTTTTTTSTTHYILEPEVMVYGSCRSVQYLVPRLISTTFDPLWPRISCLYILPVVLLYTHLNVN